MKATIKDVAKLAGVSFKTVSRVINHEPSVGEELKAKVWVAVDELNYQPNLSARQMRGGASFIAFIYDNPNSHYVIDMQRGLLDECKRQGYELLIHPTDSKSQDSTDELIRLAANSHIAGLVLTPPFSESDDLTQSLLAKNIDFVRILSGSVSPDQLGPCVFVDDYQAAFEITDYLIGLGHRSIAFLGGHEDHRSSVERYNGFKAALEHHSIPLDPQLVMPGDYDFDSGAQRSAKLFELAPRPTAIFACNDEIAAGALFAARISAIEVPESVSIVGFEDSPFSRQTWPKLTTAHQPNIAIAECAARLLIDVVRPSKQDDQLHEVPDCCFQPRLLARDSTGPVPS
jgi:LacI family transcriptional regulator